jgi:hypothetical protein
MFQLAVTAWAIVMVGIGYFGWREVIRHRGFEPQDVFLVIPTIGAPVFAIYLWIVGIR